MAKPFAKPSAWSEVLQPFVDAGRRFRNPARPQAIYQDAAAVVATSRLVSALELHVASFDRLAPSHAESRS
jgi:hypothetical protein